MSLIMKQTTVVWVFGAAKKPNCMLEMPEEFVLQSYKSSNIQGLGSLQLMAARRKKQRHFPDNP